MRADEGIGSKKKEAPIAGASFFMSRSPPQSAPLTAPPNGRSGTSSVDRVLYDYFLPPVLLFKLSAVFRCV